jgi:hypothetical protein
MLEVVYFRGVSPLTSRSLVVIDPEESPHHRPHLITPPVSPPLRRPFP